MRLWSLHPSHLDRVGLVACWRETLLAQHVLAGKTRGYRNHPQLARFLAQEKPLSAIGAYLTGLLDEATERGYRFDASKILLPSPPRAEIPVTEGQMQYEWQHLGAKLVGRSPADAERWQGQTPRCHPLFVEVPGEIESWERV